MEDIKEKKHHKSSGKHKNKKSKKHKHKKERQSSSSDSGSDNVEMEWVEAPPPPKVEVRDSWMQDETFVPTLSREQMTSGLTSRERKRQVEAQRKEKDNEVMKSRELNPHWDKGGTGLPEEEKAGEAPRLPSHSVGDGGYGHLQKARIRIREQAEREGRTMEEVAVERWGSLAALDALIAEAEARMYEHSHNRHRTDRKGDRRSPERWSPEQSFRFQKPSDYDRHHRKNKCNMSSTRRSDKDSKKVSPSTSFSRDRDVSPSRIHAEKQRDAGQPAWKKAKPIVDAKIELQESSPTKSPERVQSTMSSYEEDTSEKSLNRLAAKRMRAELLGNSAPRSKEEESVAMSSRDSHRVMLTKMDSSGQQRPVVSSREDAGFERKTDRKQKRNNKYFDDSSKYSLKQMFEREKLTTTEDNLEMFLEVSAQCQDSMEDNETSDISKRAMQKMGHTAQEEKDIKKAMQQHQKLSSVVEKCEYCLDKPNMKQHLIVSIYDQVFVSIPNFQTLTEGHCLIVPKRHVPSFLTLDEDEWNGFQDALGAVRRLFRERGKSVLCMETSLHFGRCPHAVAECIPVPEEQGDLAPLYFKKAILESEEEWAHNIKLVDLSKKGLRRSIPKNLPYFAILFDPAIHGGYAHVIEDEKAFPRNFGKEVVGGMLDIDYNHLYKNRREDPMKKSKEAVDFTKMWEEFHGE